MIWEIWEFFHKNMGVFSNFACKYGRYMGDYLWIYIKLFRIANFDTILHLKHLWIKKYKSKSNKEWMSQKRIWGWIWMKIWEIWEDFAKIWEKICQIWELWEIWEEWGPCQLIASFKFETSYTFQTPWMLGWIWSILFYPVTVFVYLWGGGTDIFGWEGGTNPGWNWSMK